MTTAQAVEEWRYDAAEHDPLTAFRLPVVTTFYPHWKYHVCVCVEDGYWPSVRPSDAEAGALLIALDYALDWYKPSYRQQLAEKAPFDLDSGTNTLTFAKRKDNGGWQYRRMTWTQGYTMMPPWDGPPASLLDVLDRAFGHGDEPNPKWEAKKALHPATFAHPEVCTVWMPDGGQADG